LNPTAAPGGRRGGGLHRLLRRAGRALRPPALALGLLALIAGLAFLVAFPLWYFSTRARPAFTAVTCGLLAAGLLFLAARGLRRAGRRAGGAAALWRLRILPGLRTAALVLAGLAAEGRTTIHGLEHLDRGYQRLDDKLAALGAPIRRVDEAG